MIVPLFSPIKPLSHSQAEESEEEEEEKAEASYDYLSPFLPALIGMQTLTREQAFEVGVAVCWCSYLGRLWA